MTRDEAAGVVIAKVMQYEGGIADVGDGMGVTRFGQTSAWLIAFGLTAPTTPAEAIANYRTWLVKTRLIGVCDEADAFALAVIDWAVHAGHTVAIRGLQRALGEHADGILGPETQAAIEHAPRRQMACRIVAERTRFTCGLLADPTRSKFARGWGNRLADQIASLAEA